MLSTSQPTPPRDEGQNKRDPLASRDTSPGGPGRVARNTASMMGNQAGINLLQAAYFVFVARLLGVSGYGTFSALVALIALVSPFGSLGALNLMIRRIAIDASVARREFTTAVMVTVIGGIVLGTLILCLAPTVAPHSSTLYELGLIAAGDLLGVRLTLVAGGVFQARERMARTAILPVLVYALRLLFILGAVALNIGVTVRSWAVMYASAALIVGLGSVIYTARLVGMERPRPSEIRREWRDGLLFALGFSAQSVYNDIDKAMLGRLSTAAATGVYATAYRIVDMAFTPMRALLAAAYARFFVAGESGLASSVRLAKRMIRPATAYCVFASIALFSCAGLAPVIFGPSYSSSVGAIRGLALLPILKEFHYLAADSLSGARMQGVRTIAQVCVAILNVGLNLILIPRYGWHAAVVTSLISDGTLAIFLWALVGLYLHREASHSSYPRHRAVRA